MNLYKQYNIVAPKLFDAYIGSYPYDIDEIIYNSYDQPIIVLIGANSIGE